MTARRPGQLPLDLPHAVSTERDDLVVTASNRVAVEAVEAWPAWPHPVLLVVGPPGSGKTHLLETWVRRAGGVRHGPGQGGPAGPAAGFAVAVDDLDRGGADEAELFALVNAARLGGGTVLVTSRARPAGMGLTLSDLRSRLRAAATVELGPPDDELLSGVLLKLFADRQIAVDPRLAGFAAARMERSLEAARDLVARIDRETLASKGKVSRPLLQRVLVEIEGERRP